MIPCDSLIFLYNFTSKKQDSEFSRKKGILFDKTHLWKPSRRTDEINSRIGLTTVACSLRSAL
ncbi:hypothetical protein RvY_16309 [Ramazzottius varieornatus]|uniref:Uncharacterized protein n=1 Tax=Ramazzottius varieornatus TaxID=947166 RepID=A0A1D1VY04_RAMVA|nr:hypothetical protein RvY_16309 [Ramazzottius varieornatus]